MRLRSNAHILFTYRGKRCMHLVMMLNIVTSDIEGVVGRVILISVVPFSKGFVLDCPTNLCPVNI